MDIQHSFQNDWYQEHNRRRQEHLATLGLDIAGRSILEIGAGVGDHTGFFLSRGSKVTSTDARPQNIDYLGRRFPEVKTYVYDADGPVPDTLMPHDIVYAYGLLYHLKNPRHGLRSMASLCRTMLLLETCVSYGDDLSINLVPEAMENPTQSVSGSGCRPTRSWVFHELKQYFEFVYVTATQPWHEEFPTVWSVKPVNRMGLFRSVFVAARQPISSDLLSERLLTRQRRC